jgi:hypothetical protein
MNSEIVMEIPIPSQIIMIMPKSKDLPLAEQNRIRRRAREEKLGQEAKEEENRAQGNNKEGMGHLKVPDVTGGDIQRMVYILLLSEVADVNLQMNGVVLSHHLYLRVS